MSTYYKTSEVFIKPRPKMKWQQWMLLSLTTWAVGISISSVLYASSSLLTALYLIGLICSVPLIRDGIIVFSTHTYQLVLGAIFTTIHTLALSCALYHFIQMGWLTINGVLLFHGGEIILLIVLLTCTWTIHLMFYTFVRGIRQHASTLKLLTYLLISACIVAFTYTSVQGSLITAICCAIYFLLLDLFCEERQVGLLWLIVWTITLVSFIAFGIFAVERTLSTSAYVPMINAFSIFSLLFVLSGLLYIPVAYLNTRYNLLPTLWNFKFFNHSQLTNRVQLSILLTLLFSFVAIGVISIYQISIMTPTEREGDFQKIFTQALLNTYVFLFLIGLVISIRLSAYIRTPLVDLGKKLKDVQLNKENKQIYWQGSDEIANLINEYNQMITKLEDNAQLLAQSERDTAWREMSKQVAHEIKNPLTPMKLSLQHLQRSIEYGRDDIQDITLRMCDTLMNQVENLSQIADEFSNFGSLPKANNKKVLLNEIVETIHDLFRKREDMDIRLIEPIDDIHVYADKNQLVRILNNLVKNSVQAIPADRTGLIELKLWEKDTNAIIRVRDNGAGIPLKMQSQIFKPKFTTKSSGSGLGLAIAANMVDSIGGRIYFHSDGETGTDFFVELPLVRSKVNDTESQRVML